MSDKNKTYCLINYGCQMNESDTEHYAGQLQELGYTPNPDSVSYTHLTLPTT